MANKRVMTVEEANFRHLVMDIAWFGIALAATSRFLSVYAIHLGANPAQLGWLNAMPALVLLISSSFGSWWRRHFSDSVHAHLWPGLGFRLMFLLPAFAPFFPREWQVFWLIAAISIPTIPQGIASVTFIGMMRESILETRMGQLISRRSTALNFTLALGALGFGLVLEWLPFPLNYQVMFFTAFIAALLSWRHCAVLRVVVPPAPAQPSGSVLLAWRSPAFRQIAFITVTIHITFMVILPIVPLHLVQNLRATEGFMALFGLLELVAGATIALYTPRLMRWLGSRGMIAVAMVGTSASAFILALAPSLPFTLLSALLAGACWTAAATIGLFAFFNENTPHEQTVAFSTAYLQVIGLSAFIGPLIGSALASQGISLVHVLLIGAVLRLAAGPIIDASWLRHIAHPRKLFAGLAARP